MLDSEGFIKLAKQYVWEMAKASLCPTDNTELTMDDVYVVTYAYVLGGQKAMLSTTLPDGKYYEVTYNTSKGEIYVDQYVKINQKVYRYIDLNESKVAMASDYGESCKSPYQQFIDSIDEEPIAPMRKIEEGLFKRDLK
jgi:hypothetical protein